jgi:hypothetical protein
MSKSSQSANGALACLPQGFGELDTPISTPEINRVPYIQFVYAKSKNYGAMLQKIPTLREGEPVLVLPAPANPIKLNPLRYFLLHASEYWGQYNTSGELVAVSRTKPDDPQAKPKWDQVIEAAVLVVLDDRLVPAQVRFKTTTCPAIYPAILALAEAKTGAWVKKGPEYAFTAKCDKPWARFVTHASRTERTNRERGTVYSCMEAQVHPTNASEFVLLSEFFNTEENVGLLNEVAAAYRKRVEAAKGKDRELVAA